MSSTPLTVDCVIDSGDTAWVNTSTAIVLMMSPALALFEGGLLRSKNNISVIIQIFTGIILISLIWWICGYSLAFGQDHNGILGDLQNAFFIDVDYTSCSYHAPTIPIASFAMFQMVFAIITPLLVTGGFAERLTFKAYVLWLVLWHILIYLPVAHWIFADGWMSNLGVLDFAGGIVIHTTAGMSSLTSALIIGKRVDFHVHHGDPTPSSIPMATLGMCLIWTGWYGFNGGSAGASGSVSTSAIVATQLGASASGFVWFVLAWWLDGKVTAAVILNGPLAGLAGITPASGYVNAPAAILCGVILGLASFFNARFVKKTLKIDDALDVSSVHGLTGVIGSVFLGFFAQLRLNSGGADGAVYGSGSLLWKQIMAVIFVGVYTAIFNTAILYFCKKVCGGLRVSPEQELKGLDVSDHDGIAYVMLEAEKEGDVRSQLQSVEEEIAKNKKNDNEVINGGHMNGNHNSYVNNYYYNGSPPIDNGENHQKHNNNGGVGNRQNNQNQNVNNLNRPVDNDNNNQNGHRHMYSPVEDIELGERDRAPKPVTVVSARGNKVGPSTPSPTNQAWGAPAPGSPRNKGELIRGED